MFFFIWFFLFVADGLEVIRGCCGLVCCQGMFVERMFPCLYLWRQCAYFPGQMGMMSSGVFIAGVCSMMLFHPIDSEEQADRIVDLLERSVLMFRCARANLWAVELNIPWLLVWRQLGILFSRVTSFSHNLLSLRIVYETKRNETPRETKRRATF
jgi:hypothetical protein